jgi:hypothetical protein
LHHHRLRAEHEAEGISEMSAVLLAAAGCDGYLRAVNPALPT